MSQILTEEQHELANASEYNFDHPNAFDIDLLVETLKRLKSGKKVEIPLYNFTTHSREKQTVSMTIGYVNHIPTMQFFSEIQEILSVSGNPKIMHCGILVNMPYFADGDRDVL